MNIPMYKIDSIYEGSSELFHDYSGAFDEELYSEYYGADGKTHRYDHINMTFVDVSDNATSGSAESKKSKTKKKNSKRGSKNSNDANHDRDHVDNNTINEETELDILKYVDKENNVSKFDIVEDINVTTVDTTIDDSDSEKTDELDNIDSDMEENDISKDMTVDGSNEDFDINSFVHDDTDKNSIKSIDGSSDFGIDNFIEGSLDVYSDDEQHSGGLDDHIDIIGSGIETEEELSDEGSMNDFVGSDESNVEFFDGGISQSDVENDASLSEESEEEDNVSGNEGDTLTIGNITYKKSVKGYYEPIQDK